MSLGFGPLGPLGGSSASSIPSEDQSTNSNFFQGPNPFQNLNNQFKQIKEKNNIQVPDQE